MRLHTEEDPYRCTFKGCNRCFSSPKSLKRHETIWHNSAGGEPSIEHILREKVLRLQNRYRVRILSSTYCIGENNEIRPTIKEGNCN